MEAAAADGGQHAGRRQAPINRDVGRHTDVAEHDIDGCADVIEDVASECLQRAVGGDHGSVQVDADLDTAEDVDASGAADSTGSLAKSSTRFVLDKLDGGPHPDGPASSPSTQRMRELQGVAGGASPQMGLADEILVLDERRQSASDGGFDLAFALAQLGGNEW